MTLTEYALIDDPGTRAGKELAELAVRAPRKASRLVTALEDFLNEDVASITRLAPSLDAGESKAEVFLVPPLSELDRFPDAAALVLINHATKRVEFIRCIQDCGGPGYDWMALIAEARKAVA